MHKADKRSVLSLYTGAGGLDLGLEEAGFKTVLCVEMDPDSQKTIRRNRPAWRLSDPNDVHSISPKEILHQTGLKPRQLTLLAGGPPCQPFSKSAYWSNGDGRRLKDPRARTLRAYIRVAEAALPKVLLLENVKGLTYAGKGEGIELLRREIAAINRRHRTKYKLQTIHVNTADYGVPQIRERVFLVASRDGKTLRMPMPTHGEGDGLKPFLTAWDAIGHLDRDTWSAKRNPTGKWAALLRSIPEGQNYLWHTKQNKVLGGQPLFGWRTRYWSFLLKLAKAHPAWTIQAEPGPATGPFHWRSRVLSVEELCRLQTFPSGYRIMGARRSARRQVGNAVPSVIGELLGLEIRRQFLGERVRRTLRLLPSRRHRPPAAEAVSRVPKKYLKLRGRHRDHPGPGRGPGARLRQRKLKTST